MESQNTIKNIEALKNFNIYVNLENIVKNSRGKELVFLCVGNPKVWFDSFGPMVGSLLMMLDVDKFIYGNVRCAITAQNLEQYVDMIYRFHNNPYVVVVDNAISGNEEIVMKIKQGSLKCGCLSKNPIVVGDSSITFCLSRQNMKNPNNYLEMVKEIKKLGHMLKFVLKHKKQ